MEEAEPLLSVVEHLERRAHVCSETLSKLQKAKSAEKKETGISGCEERAKASQGTLRNLQARVSGFEGALQHLERLDASVLRPAVQLLRESQPDPEVVRRLCLMPMLPPEMDKLKTVSYTHLTLPTTPYV